MSIEGLVVEKHLQVTFTSINYKLTVAGQFKPELFKYELFKHEVFNPNGIRPGLKLWFENSGDKLSYK